MRRTLLSVLVALTIAGGVIAKDTDPYNKVNGSVEVSAGEHVDKVSTVNGSVRVGDRAVVQKAQTVNGSVRLGDSASADKLDTVNGAVNLGAKAKVSGDVKSVNGRVYLDKGADIGGRLYNVNGEIELDNAHVGQGIETVNADLTVGSNSKVEGGILYKKPQGNGWRDENRNPKVVIGPHAVVKGDLTFERPVDLFVSDSASVGNVQGATAKKFSGSAP
ncbi:MAG: hypothetical protein GAK28_01604 [Luteibacter sp.]|uniref:hypothetical protein n=1 Tax=Luteibacter sp. TaxID=1886636 RepID=UPI00137F4710|nr:hypothetical protein [Luteibacter sp.]KAF1007647.1 MAG: hypothetical protein GAK28_01604 [Luteibacter sp.]